MMCQCFHLFDRRIQSGALYRDYVDTNTNLCENTWEYGKIIWEYGKITIASENFLKFKCISWS